MSRGATSAHTCYFIDIWCIYAPGGRGMHRATSACAEALLMHTHFIWSIFDVNMILGVGVCAEAILMRTNVIWLTYGAHMILGLGYA